MPTATSPSCATPVCPTPGSWSGGPRRGSRPAASVPSTRTCTSVWSPPSWSRPAPGTSRGWSGSSPGTTSPPRARWRPVRVAGPVPRAPRSWLGSPLGAMERGNGPPGALLGRRRECAALDDLMVGVKGGASAALVLHGEAGIGKSALLDHVGDTADGCRVARVAGVEAEVELAFGGLHQLCAPFLDR